MALACQGFGEDVNDLNRCGDMRESDNLAVIGFSDGVTINLYVLRLFMVNSCQHAVELVVLVRNQALKEHHATK